MALISSALALAFTGALNPTLLTATTVMLFAGEPRRLMSGYLLDAYTISISLGLVIVFALQNSGAVSTTQKTLSPAADIVLGLVPLLVAYVIHSERDRCIEKRRRARAEAKDPKEPPRWRKVLDNGSARSALVVGVLFDAAGASYLAGMTRISKENASTGETVLAVVLFCVIMLILIEVPVAGFVFRPVSTRREVKALHRLARPQRARDRHAVRTGDGRAPAAAGAIALIN